MEKEWVDKLGLKIKIIEAFLEDDELAYYYRYFEKKTGATREQIKPIMDELRKAEMVELVRGLMNDDGEVAGSGFALTYRATQWSIREWLEELKKMFNEVNSPSPDESNKE